MADVAVELTGDVTGLKKPMQIDPDYAAYLVNSPEAYRRLLLMCIVVDLSSTPCMLSLLFRLCPACRSWFCE
jgi:hypothetical protein